MYYNMPFVEIRYAKDEKKKPEFTVADCIAKSIMPAARFDGNRRHIHTASIHAGLNSSAQDIREDLQRARIPYK